MPDLPLETIVFLIFLIFSAISGFLRNKKAAQKKAQQQRSATTEADLLPEDPEAAEIVEPARKESAKNPGFDIETFLSVLSGEPYLPPSQSVASETRTEKPEEFIRPLSEQATLPSRFTKEFEKYQTFDTKAPAARSISASTSRSRNKAFGGNQAYKELFGSKKRLRDAFVLKEIIDKPVSLSEPD